MYSIKMVCIRLACYLKIQQSTCDTCNQISAWYMVYFFSKAEKSNSLALTDCVNAFFLRLAGILKLRKKAGESSSKWFFVVFSLFPSPEFSCVRWVGKCLIKNRLSSSSSFYLLALIIVRLCL